MNPYGTLSEFVDEVNDETINVAIIKARSFYGQKVIESFGENFNLLKKNMCDILNAIADDRIKELLHEHDISERIIQQVITLYSTVSDDEKEKLITKVLDNDFNKVSDDNVSREVLERDIDKFIFLFILATIIAGNTLSYCVDKYIDKVPELTCGILGFTTIIDFVVFQQNKSYNREIINTIYNILNSQLNRYANLNKALSENIAYGLISLKALSHRIIPFDIVNANINSQINRLKEEAAEAQRKFKARKEIELLARRS